MARGFIRNPLDIKLLILYILARAKLPLDMAQLTDLVLCDEGVDYFQFADALGSLKTTGHVKEDADYRLSITPKGRANGAICEDELPYSVRLRCDRSVAELNQKMERMNQVRSSITPRENGDGVTVSMVLDDDSGNIMTLSMLAPDTKQGTLLAAAFQENAEKIYNVVLTALLNEKKFEGETHMDD